MDALEFLNSKGIKTPTINATRLPDSEFGLHSVTELMDEYLEYKLNNLSQHIVSKSFTNEQLVDMHDDAYIESFDEWKSKWF